MLREAVRTTTPSASRRSDGVVVFVDTSDPGLMDLAHAYVNRVGDGRVVDVRCVHPVPGASTDPYGMADLVGAVMPHDVVLVAPRRHGARRIVDGPVVGGSAVGLVQALPAGSTEDAVGRADVGAAPWVVAAMAKNVFLDASDSWAERLLAAGRPCVDLRADRARRSDLLEAFSAGPAVVLYAGHGSPRGWAGYQALRLDHIETSCAGGAPIGLMMAFACKTLARHRNRWPFGSRLVETGTCRAYLAPASSVATADAEALAEIVVDLLAERGGGTVGDLMRRIEASTHQDAAAARAWATFRLVGDPLTVIT